MAKLFIGILFSLYFLFSPLIFVKSTYASELDLTGAQSAVGKRFAKVFCEAKNDGLSSDSASEFALNNTYLKFVAFPDDEKYMEDLWLFTINQIRIDCGDKLTTIEETELKEFFKEEERIASNRDLYLPKFEDSLR